MPSFTALPGRLDAVTAELCKVSRSQASQWIAAGQVRVNAQVVSKAGHKLRGGEALRVTPPPPADLRVLPEHVPLDILYEDEALIAINKPPGMTTHPAPGLSSGTVVNALLGRMNLPEQAGVHDAGSYRPGIVHRLDKDTSGVLVVAKTVGAHAALSQSFKERLTQKVYLAIAAGQWKAASPLTVDAPIGRHPVQRQRMTVGGAHPREAQTRFIPLATQTNAQRTLALVRCEPHTGRTHQIRVHLAHLGSPIVGDSVYGRESQVMARQALHAWQLTIPHPLSAKPLHLLAPPPDDLLSAWVALGGAWPANLSGPDTLH